MTDRRGYTLRVPRFLARMPQPSRSGCCCGYDASGEPRYRYWFFPDDKGLVGEFWREDVGTDAWQRLADPVFPANSNTFLSAVVMDPSREMVFLFNAVTAGTFASWQVYDVAANTWAALNTATLALAGVPAGGVNLAHPCPVVGAGSTSDAHVYLAISGLLNLFRYDVAANTWLALAGAGGARAVAPGTGVTLSWETLHGGYLVSVRGNATSAIDLYELATDTWSVIACAPGSQTWGAGVEASAFGQGPGIVILSYLGRLYMLHLQSSAVETLGTLHDYPGVAHLGNRLSLRRVGGAFLVATPKYASDELRELELVL